MFRTTLCLALLCVWSPTALAFPPCPEDPIDVLPVDGADGLFFSDDPRYDIWYRYVGDPEVVFVFQATPYDDGLPPHTGNCRNSDMVPLPGLNASTQSIGLSPSMAPRAGYGLLALPDLRAHDGFTSIVYRYDFAIAQAGLVASGDWVDTMELSFHWNDWPNGSALPSARYRLRVLKTAPGTTVAQVIEVRTLSNTADPNPPVSEGVIATIPLGMPAAATPLALRWTQTRSPLSSGDECAPPGWRGDELNGSGTIDDGVSTASSMGEASAPVCPDHLDQMSNTTIVANSVDSTFELVGADNQVLYRAELPGQWANGLSVGLLNHHTPSANPTAWDAGVVIEDSRLRIEQ